MEDHAFVSVVHVEPPSTQVSQMDVVVKYGQKSVRLHIPLTPPLEVHQPRRELVAQELRDLGMALLRIADQPSKIFDHNPNRN